MSTFFSKTLSFLGLAEEEIDERDSYELEKNPELNYEDYKHLYEEKSKNDAESVFRRNRASSRSTRSLHAVGSSGKEGKLRVAVSEPHAFEEVQLIGDDLKMGVPVIVNLQVTNNDLSKRVIDFCSGLTYALGGSIKKVADKVFLITPHNAVVTSCENEVLNEEGLYNQL